MRQFTILLAGLSLLGACGLFEISPPEQAEPDPAPTEAPAPTEEAVIEIESVPAPASAPPATLSVENDVLFANAEFPSELWKIAPALDAELRGYAEAEFAQMQADAERYQREDPDYFMPYGLGLEWKLLGAAGDLVSLHGFHYYQTGGAHPNFLLTGQIYNRATNETVEVLDLFDETEHAAMLLVGLVREDIAAQKRERYGEAGIENADIEAEVEELFPDTGLALGQAALSGSTVADRFGGLKVYFSPYDIGPYAEGSYTVTIPQSAFAGFLAPEYADLFDGEPPITLNAED